MTTFASRLAILGLAACASRSPSPTLSSTAPTVPDGWRALAGPHPSLADACAGCQLSKVTPLAAGSGFVAVALGTRGMDSLLALQTSRGWYIEVREPMPPMESHHEPRSIYYDLAQTRVGDGVVVRLVHSHNVFYPGQGNDGTSSTLWFDRSCRMFGDQIACGEPVSVGTQHCTRETRGDGAPSETCTGDKPPASTMR